MPWQVCNHPDLFEGRPIVSAFDMEPGLIRRQLPSLALRALEADPWRRPDLDRLLLLPAARQGMCAWEAAAVQVRKNPAKMRHGACEAMSSA